MNTGKIIVGVLTGLAVGIALGILFSKDKDSNTSTNASGKGEKYSDLIKEKFDKFMNMLVEKFGDAKDEADDLVVHSKEKYHELKDKVAQATS